MSEVAASQDTGVFARSAARRRLERQWRILAVISVGGGIGSVARYLIEEALPTPVGGVPWATFLINVTGSLALGFLMVYVLEVWPPRRYVRPFIGVGILGGYTTFSTYTTEIRALLAGHAWATGTLYALGSLALGLVAVWAGIVGARYVSGRPLRRGAK